MQVPRYIQEIVEQDLAEKMVFLTGPISLPGPHWGTGGHPRWQGTGYALSQTPGRASV